MVVGCLYTVCLMLNQFRSLALKAFCFCETLRGSSSRGSEHLMLVNAMADQRPAGTGKRQGRG